VSEQVLQLSLIQTIGDICLLSCDFLHASRCILHCLLRCLPDYKVMGVLWRGCSGRS
jgi:hypothetical protein